MRPASSRRAVASIGTTTSSSRISRSISRRCRTITSLASANTRLQKVSVTVVIQQCGDHGRETQKRVPTQMRSLYDLYVGGLRQQHPHGYLQTPARCVDDTDRAISLLGSANDLQGHAMKGVERVEDSNVRRVCAQGSVGAGSSTCMSTASSPAAPCRGTAPGGSAGARRFCFPSTRSRSSSAPSISPAYRSPSRTGI